MRKRAFLLGPFYQDPDYETEREAQRWVEGGEGEKKGEGDGGRGRERIYTCPNQL